jgi:YVTN family beta-propeller protein
MIFLSWGLFNSISAVKAETLFVTLEKDNALAVVDPIAGKLLDTIAVGKRPRGIIIGSDGKRLYVATSDDHAIQVIDIASMKVIAALPSGDDPEPSHSALAATPSLIAA